jgi:hypothetical protein
MSTASPRWRQTVGSSLLYVIAFNLIYFLQELSLVVPKALTPGLYPTLFHNNHTWTGQNPRQELLQGTGALAILLAGIFFAYLLRRHRFKSPTGGLFIFWMAYQGFFQSLPQIVIGVINPLNDVGRAMLYLHFSYPMKMVAAGLAIITMTLAGVYLASCLVDMAGIANQIDSFGKRFRLVFSTATVPAFLAIPLIIPFRIPRNVEEVVLVPLIVAVVGTIALQGGSIRRVAARPDEPKKAISLRYPFAAVLVLLLIFQFVLRRGIRF